MRIGNSLIGIIQEAVDKIVEKEKYEIDYGREFKVSILQDLYNKDTRSYESEKILLSVYAGDFSFSRVIFPKNTKDSVYGLDTLEEEVKYLFNTTM